MPATLGGGRREATCVGAEGATARRDGGQARSTPADHLCPEPPAPRCRLDTERGGGSAGPGTPTAASRGGARGSATEEALCKQPPSPVQPPAAWIPLRLRTRGAGLPRRGDATGTARDPDGNAASSRPRPVCSRRRLSCPPTCDARSSPTQGGCAGAAQARRDTPRHTSAAALNRKDLGGGTPRKHADRQTACGKFRPAPSGEAHSSTPALGFYSLALPSLPGPCRGRVPRHQRAPTFGPKGAREAPKSHGPQIRGRCSSPPPRSAFRSPSRGIQGKMANGDVSPRVCP